MKLFSIIKREGRTGRKYSAVFLKHFPKKRYYGIPHSSQSAFTLFVCYISSYLSMIFSCNVFLKELFFKQNKKKKIPGSLVCARLLA